MRKDDFYRAVGKNKKKQRYNDSEIVTYSSQNDPESTSTACDRTRERVRERCGAVFKNNKTKTALGAKEPKSLEYKTNGYDGSLHQLLMIKDMGVARVFDWGAPKPQITCNDVIRNFEKGIFRGGQKYRRMEDQKPWPSVGT